MKNRHFEFFRTLNALVRGLDDRIYGLLTRNWQIWLLDCRSDVCRLQAVDLAEYESSRCRKLSVRPDEVWRYHDLHVGTMTVWPGDRTLYLKLHHLYRVRLDDVLGALGA